MGRAVGPRILRPGWLVLEVSVRAEAQAEGQQACNRAVMVDMRAAAVRQESLQDRRSEAAAHPLVAAAVLQAVLLGSAEAGPAGLQAAAEVPLRAAEHQLPAPGVLDWSLCFGPRGTNHEIRTHR
jgi:hypothetical protein